VVRPEPVRAEILRSRLIFSAWFARWTPRLTGLGPTLQPVHRTARSIDGLLTPIGRHHAVAVLASGRHSPTTFFSTMLQAGSANSTESQPARCSTNAAATSRIVRQDREESRTNIAQAATLVTSLRTNSAAMAFPMTSRGPVVQWCSDHV
jgi:hypothetical protein